MIRTFIAIAVPIEVKNEIVVAQDSFRELGERGISWVKSQGVHLTLQFLGDVEENTIGEIVEAVSNVTVALRPLSLSTTVTGAFPKLNRPRVFWVGVDGGDGLTHLQRNISMSLLPLGFSRDRSTFRPHLTLGRVKQLKPTSSLSRVISEYRFSNSSWQVGEVKIMSSILKPDGARYETIANCKFGSERN